MRFDDHKLNRFRWITQARTFSSRPSYDVAVLESDSFVVLPTLGALTPGWLLAVPRRPMANMSFLHSTEVEDLSGLLAEISCCLSNLPGSVFEFEHGATVGSELGCGVDQAHLHIAPLPFDLFKIAMSADDVIWNPPMPDQVPWQPVIRHEYLFIRTADGRSNLGKPNRPQSQWFRRLIARELGQAESWDYKLHPALPMISETVSLIGGTNDQST